MLKQLAIIAVLAFATGAGTKAYFATKPTYDENMRTAATCAGLPDADALSLAHHVTRYTPGAIEELSRVQIVRLDKRDHCDRIGPVDRFVLTEHEGRIERVARWGGRKAFETSGEDNALIYAVTVD